MTGGYNQAGAEARSGTYYSDRDDTRLIRMHQCGRYQEPRHASLGYSQESTGGYSGAHPADHINAGRLFHLQLGE